MFEDDFDTKGLADSIQAIERFIKFRAESNWNELLSHAKDLPEFNTELQLLKVFYKTEAELELAFAKNELVTKVKLEAITRNLIGCIEALNDPELVSEAKMLLVKCNFLAGDSATVRETALHSELNLDSIRSCRLYADVLFMLIFCMKDKVLPQVDPTSNCFMFIMELIDEIGNIASSALGRHFSAVPAGTNPPFVRQASDYWRMKGPVQPSVYKRRFESVTVSRFKNMRRWAEKVQVKIMAGKVFRLIGDMSGATREDWGRLLQRFGAEFTLIGPGQHIYGEPRKAELDPRPPNFLVEEEVFWVLTQCFCIQREDI